MALFSCARYNIVTEWSPFAPLSPDQEGPMARDARMSDLISANRGFEQQMRDWQTERHQKGENPFDWQAFRTLEAYIGATDPGDEPPAEFYWFMPPTAARSRTLVATG